MAGTWLQIKVELVGGRGEELEPPPGRVFAVAPTLTFERFADAINRAFGRWDLSHLHMFEMADANKDGRVTLQEAQTAALQHFDMVDTNRDGQITPEERMQMHQRIRAAHKQG